MYGKVIFVCSDNTCCSIMAEAVLKSVDRGGLDICSRGLVVLFPEPVNPKALEAMETCRLCTDRKYSAGLEAGDLTPDTLVLTMTDREKQQAKRRFPYAEGIYSLGEFVGSAVDVEMPYGGTPEDYEKCCEYIDFLVKLAAEILYK